MSGAPSDGAIVVAAVGDEASGSDQQRRAPQDISHEIDNKKRLITDLGRDIEVLHLELNAARLETTPTPDLPLEILDNIFDNCDAKTRLSFAATNSVFQKRYAKWTDVRSVHIVRKPVEVTTDATVIPHKYEIRTNVPSLRVVIATRLTAFGVRVPAVKTLVLESNQHMLATQCGGIPQQIGFFSCFQAVEFVKICDIYDNLRLDYTLEELFSLPKLAVLHIKEDHTFMFHSRESGYAAPLRELKLSCRVMPAVTAFEAICQAFAGSLTHLDVNLGSQLRRTQITHLNAISTNLQYLTELALPASFTRVRENLPLLQNLSSLKTLSMASIAAESLPDVINALPPACQHLTVTEQFAIGGRVISLLKLVDVPVTNLLDEDTVRTLQDVCLRVDRVFTLQLGRLRGLNPEATTRTLTANARLVINSQFQHKRAGFQDRRVFLMNGSILSRHEFLQQIGITTSLPEPMETTTPYYVPRRLRHP